MRGLDSFLYLFGNITVFQIVEFALAFSFIVFICKQIKKYVQQKNDNQRKQAEADRLKDEQLTEALSEVRKYTVYRQQSIEIYRQLQEKIADIDDKLVTLDKRQSEMEESTKRRERNKIRDRLLQNYRYYTSLETNPSHCWTEMEADAFWELFGEYEEAGGDGYMHSDVQPAMQKLKIINKS